VPKDGSKGLSLDDQGRVKGIVDAEDPRETHILGDLDVHA
jgi:hypothetical protein